MVGVKRSMLTQMLILIALGYALFVLLIFFTQSRLVYFPGIGREVTVTPQAAGLAFESLRLRTEDGEELDAWWVPVAAPRGVVLFFHGNAGNISHRLDYLLMFHRLGYSTFIFDYRGYGRSTGAPSEEGTYRDALAAWRWLTGERRVRASDIVLFGESLGAAVASWLAVRHAPRALILASTFTSVPDLGAELYPYLPVRLISRFRYDNVANLGSIQTPVMIAHSPQDEIIPYRHGQALYAVANAPKQFLEMAGGHNDGFVFAREEWVRALEAFLARVQPVPAKAGY
jgi:fermentation-respiration switch protein FrsA (DUF1100 family)